MTVNTRRITWISRVSTYLHEKKHTIYLFHRAFLLSPTSRSRYFILRKTQTRVVGTWSLIVLYYVHCTFLVSLLLLARVKASSKKCLHPLETRVSGDGHSRWRLRHASRRIIFYLTHNYIQVQQVSTLI